MQSTTRRGRILFLLVSGALAVPLAVGTLSRAVAQAGADQGDSIYKNLSVFTEVLSLIQRGYVDETSVPALFAGAFDGMADALDPLATYVPAPHLDEYRKALDVGSAHSGLLVVRSSGISYVVAVEDASPAAGAGIEGGDIITSIDGDSTREMPLWDLQTRLAAADSVLDVSLLRRGRSIEVELPVGPFEGRPPSLDRHRGVPVLRLARFDGRTVSYLENLLEEVRKSGSERLVIDLRDVAGGQPEVAYGAAALLAEGDLGELQTKAGRADHFSADTDVRWRGRLAVLINGGSQGAAEVLATVLSQAADARLVGRRSFGLAGRRGEQRLSNGAVLFLTDAFYTGPDGEPIRKGLEPDERVDGGARSGGDGERQEDPVLRRALDLLEEVERSVA